MLLFSAEPKSPNLFPLISFGTSQEETTTIGCLAKDFLPGSIDFSFVDQVSNNYSNGFKKYNSVLQSGGTYSACSQIKVPTQGWQNSDSYYCNAKHLDKTISAVLQIPRVIGQRPILSIHPPMKDDVELNGSGRVVCFASDFYPKNIQISWKKNSEVILDAVTEEAVSNGNGSFMITSYIKVSKQAWDTDSTFSCIVTHDSSDFHEMKNVSKSTVCDQEIITDGKIKVTAVPPSFETIYMQNIAPLTCIITNMANKDGLEVTWYADNEKITNTEIEDPLYDSSIRKYTAKAIATVCPEDWRTKNFKCSVSHPELPTVEVVTIKKPNGNDAKAPIVLLYPPHPDELAKKESATMACLVKGFNPPDIFVKWMDSDNVELSNVATTGPIQEISSSNKKTFTLLSTLTLPSVQDWNSGKSYTCIVGHESLPLHTTQRTIDKTSGKPSNVNVSLVMSDSC